MRVLALILSLLASTAAARDVRLLMADEDGCMWCERWTEELGHIYPKTAEGRAAPLLRQDVDAALPDGTSLLRSLHFTPTFVLLVEGQEIGRIEGYPGEDFFWGLLGQLLADAEISFE